MEARGPDARRLKPDMASRKLLVLDFVREYVTRWGASPSYGEIAAGTDTNRTRAREAVMALAREGLLIRRPGTRGLSLPEDRAQAIRTLRELGWRVDEDIQSLAPPGVTNTALPMIPVLTYVPSQGDEHGDSSGDQPTDGDPGKGGAVDASSVALGGSASRPGRRRGRAGRGKSAR